MNGRFSGNWCTLTVLLAIVMIAFILRAFFAYDTSAGGGFALSGGSDAAYHLHVIEHILRTGGHLITDPAINYPFGGLNYSPPLFDWSIAMVAYPLTLFGFSTAEAASIALVFTTAIVGALTCIPVYLLAREMFSRRAAVVAAAFFAISSVAIISTVFSNGTASAYFVLFFVLMTLFMLRAVKALKKAESDALPVNGILAPFRDKKVLRNVLLACLSLVALQLSWIGFFSVILIISVMMIFHAVSDRFRGESATSYVSIYGSVMLLSLIISALYYVAVMGMTMIIAGPFLLALLLIVVSLMISSHRIWVITIPLSLAIVIISLLVVSFISPSLFHAMTSGYSPYADTKFGALLAAYAPVTLATQAVFAGLVTVWFSFIVLGYMLYKWPKKADSPSHIFIIPWFAALLYLSWRNTDLALLAAPMYAIGAGVVIMGVLRRVDLKGYIGNFKGATVKSVWRKMLKPIPFVAVLGTVFVLLAPNVLYAVDASIPSNEKARYNEDMQSIGIGGSFNHLGATNYFIRDSDWNMSEAWKHHLDSEKSGALVTWLDFGAEAVAHANFSIVADHFGNGYSAASNILLGTASEALAVMAVRLLTNDPAVLDSNAVPADVRDELKKIILDGRVTVGTNADTYNENFVRANPNIFGPVVLNISAENAMHLVAANYLTSMLTDGEIAEMYNNIIRETGHEISYIGVSGSMLPLYFGDGSFFSTLAYLNDFYLDRNASPVKFYTAGIPQFGFFYTYTSAMYETMLWRTLIGMSLEDQRLATNTPNLSFNEMMRGLMLSDGTIKAVPGYGLTNFVVDGWWVMYNPEGTAAGAPSDKWILLPGEEAQQRQIDEGGVINYFGGMAFLRYQSDNVLFEGSVSIDIASTSKPVSGMTVAFFDGAGELIGMTVTNEDGRFGATIEPGTTISEIRVYSGPVGSMEVMIYNSGWTAGASASVDITIPPSSMTGTIIDADHIANIDEEVIIEMTGRVSGETYRFSPNSDGTFSNDVVPDTYAVTMLIRNQSIYTGSFTLYPGAMNVGDISVRSVSVEISVFNRLAASVRVAVHDNDPVTNVEIVRIGDPSFQPIVAEIESNGIARASVAPGEYAVRLQDNEFKGEGTWMLASFSTTASLSTTFFNAALGSTARVSAYLVEATTVTIQNAKEGDIITLVNGAYLLRNAYTATVVADADGDVKITVPTGDYGNASIYTASITRGNETIYVDIPVGSTVDISNFNTLFGSYTAAEIEMTHDGEAVAGMVAFINTVNPNGPRMIVVPVSAEENGSNTIVHLPEGVYTLYAHSDLALKKAFIGAVTVASGTVTGDDRTKTDNNVITIELQDAILVSGEVRYTAATTTRVAYVPVIITTTIGGNEYTIVTATDAYGAYCVMLPSGNRYTANTETFFGVFLRQANDLVIALATDTNDRTGRNITVNVSGSGVPAGNDSDIDVGQFDGTPIVQNAASEDVLTYTFSSINATRAVLMLHNHTDSLMRVTLISPDVTFGTGASIDRGMTEVAVISPNANRSVTINYASGALPMIDVYLKHGVDTNVDTPDGVIDLGAHVSSLTLGKGISYVVTATSNPTATTSRINITLHNNSDAAQFVVMRTVSDDVSFWIGGNTSEGEALTSVPTTAGGMPVRIDYPQGSSPVIEVFVVSPANNVNVTVGTGWSELVALEKDSIGDWLKPEGAGSFNVASNNTGSVAGTSISYAVTGAAAGVAVLTLQNSSDEPLWVKLDYTGMSFRIGAGDTVSDVITMVVPAASGGNNGSVTVNVSYASGTALGGGTITVKSIDITKEDRTEEGSISNLDVRTDTSGDMPVGTSSISYSVTGAAAGVATLTLYNSGDTPLWVTAEQNGLSFRIGTGSAVNDEITVLVPAAGIKPGSVTINVTYGNIGTALGSITAEISDRQIEGTVISYEFTNVNVSEGTATLRIHNNGDTPFVVKLEYTGLSFRIGTGSTSVGEITAVVPSTGTGYITINVSFDDIEALTGGTIYVFAKNITVSQSNRAIAPIITMDPSDWTNITVAYNLRPGSYDVLIEPIAGEETGFYFSGRVTIFAGQTSLDLSNMVTEVAVVNIEVTDRYDKVTLTADGAIENQASRDRNDTIKTYYVPMSELVNGGIFTVIVENDDEIFYLDIGLNPMGFVDMVDATDMEDKVHVEGYVGRVANGEMVIEITYTHGKIGTATVPITRGTFSVDLPADNVLKYSFTPRVTSVIDGVTYEFLLDPSDPNMAFEVHPPLIKTADGERIVVNMEVLKGDDLSDDTPDVVVSNINVTYGSGGVASGTFVVDNNSGATVILSGGVGWSSIKFGYSSTLSANSYILVPTGGQTTIYFAATYDPARTGDGNANLSVIARDPTGTVLITETLAGNPATAVSLNDFAAEDLNRVSRDEYGYGFTVTNDHYESISVTLNVVGVLAYTGANWFVSIVDHNNVKLDTIINGEAITTVNGNSSASFFLRLIWTGMGEASLDNLPFEIDVRVGSDTETIELIAMNTDIHAGNMSASGNNIFDSLDGVPNLVWALIALSILMLLLIVLLGIRRGVFSRKR